MRPANKRAFEAGSLARSHLESRRTNSGAHGAI
jgi:hypothetical protein